MKIDKIPDKIINYEVIKTTKRHARKKWNVQQWQHLNLCPRQASNAPMHRLEHEGKQTQGNQRGKNQKTVQKFNNNNE